MVSGINPSEARKQQKRARQDVTGNTFEGIAREWYGKRRDRWSESYAEEMMKTFESDVFPYIGQRPIAEIKPMELMGTLSKLDERGATEKLRKVRQRCGEVWKYAIVTGRAEYNPAPDLASAFSPHKKNTMPSYQFPSCPSFSASLIHTLAAKSLSWLCVCLLSQEPGLENCVRLNGRSLILISGFGKFHPNA